MPAVSAADARLIVDGQVCNNRLIRTKFSVPNAMSATCWIFQRPTTRDPMPAAVLLLPAEDLLRELAFALAHGEASVLATTLVGPPRPRPVIVLTRDPDLRATLSRRVRLDPPLADRLREVPGVAAFFAPQRRRLQARAAFDPVQHPCGAATLGVPVGLAHPNIHPDPVTVLHQDTR
jgi:hypothetical protein